MNRRQTMPRQWLIADSDRGDRLWRAIDRLPGGSGVLLLFHELPAGQRQRLLRRVRRRAATKGLPVIDETGGAARVHNLRELRRALLARTPMILLSPLSSTQSHPGWRSIPRMRAAAYARLAGRRLVALGGMDERRFRRWSRLGFIGWAGISAFRT
jgi:thiamine-phosphate pyrophosphorylase